MEESRKVYGWLVRGGNAEVECSSMWADTMRGEYYCGNLLWQSSLTLLFLPHDANAGAWNEIGVSSIDNAAGDDFAGASFGTIPIALAAGGFEYAITNYWYVKNGAAVIGTPQPFVIEHQIFSLTPGGDFSVEKYRCTATRGTNGVTIVTRRP